MRNLLAIALIGLACSAQAQTAEIFIPGQSETAPVVEVPMNRMAACLAQPSEANCTGIDIDPGGLELESSVPGGRSGIQLETLVLDLDGDTVSSSAAPPDYSNSPDYSTRPDAPVDPYGTIALPAVAITIEFDFDSAAIRADQFGKIASLAQAFQDPALAGAAFAVIGHTDSSGSESYNCDLSQRRSGSVAAALLGAYVNLPLYQVGFGEHVPKNVYDTRAPENRRVTFLRLPDDSAPVLQTARAICRY